MNDKDFQELLKSVKPGTPTETDPDPNVEYRTIGAWLGWDGPSATDDDDAEKSWLLVERGGLYVHGPFSSKDEAIEYSHVIWTDEDGWEQGDLDAHLGTNADFYVEMITPVMDDWKPSNKK